MCAALSPRHLDVSLDMAFRRLAEVNTCTPSDLQGMTRLVLDGQVTGYLRPSFAERLLAYPDTFLSSSTPQTLTLHPSLDTPSSKTQAVARVTADLHRLGVIRGWRNELYPVVNAFHDEPLLLLERAAAPYFGIKAYGIHVNGYITNATKMTQRLWVAKRSSVKPTWPGMLDHIVAGGQPHGLSCFANVLKEAEEEASIPRHLAQRAVAAGAVSYMSLQPEGVKRDVLFVYDLELPADFVPRPLDGEVESFFLEDMDRVGELVLATESLYKPNCNLVVLDFLLRHGYLTPEHEGYLELLTGLRVGDCR